MPTTILLCAFSIALQATPPGGERSAALSVSATVIRPLRIERVEGGGAIIANSTDAEAEVTGGAVERGDDGSLLVTASDNGAPIRITLRY